jgi:hypothetical protein
MASGLEIISMCSIVTYSLQLRYLGVTMAYKIGDTVRVVGVATEEPFKKLRIGMVAQVVHVWDNTEYPYQLQGHSECLHEKEIEAVSKG